ncbi:MAG: hypothetical protein ACKVS9_11950 [Phycisphaerae bacterium]
MSLLPPLLLLIGNQFVVSSIGNPRTTPTRLFAFNFSFPFLGGSSEVAKPPFRLEFAPFGTQGVFPPYWILSLEPAAHLLLILTLALTIGWRGYENEAAVVVPLVAFCAELLLVRFIVTMGTLMVSQCKTALPSIAQLAALGPYIDIPLRAVFLMWIVYLAGRMLHRTRLIAPTDVGGVQCGIVIASLILLLGANALVIWAADMCL